MELTGMNCPHCGGALEIPEQARQVQCPFCDSVVRIDRPEPPVSPPEDHERAGYEFEKGRIRAQQEARRQEERDQRDVWIGQFATAMAGIAMRHAAPRRPRHLFWWIIGWIFCFPIPLTVLIVRSRRLKPLWKTVLLLLLWGMIVFNGVRAVEESAAARGDAGGSAAASVDSADEIAAESLSIEI